MVNDSLIRLFSISSGIGASEFLSRLIESTPMTVANIGISAVVKIRKQKMSLRYFFIFSPKT